MQRSALLPVRVAVALAGIAAITFVCSTLLRLNATTAGFCYLILVLACATLWGRAEAVLASVVSMLCFNFFFLPPVGHFTIADPQNWVALLAFLATALVASHLSDRARKQAAEAGRRQRETEQLYAFSRSILLTGASEPIGAQAAQSIARVFETPAVALFDSSSGQTFLGGEGEMGDVGSTLHQVVLLGSYQRDPAANLDVWPIAFGGRTIGALATRELRISDGAVQALLNLVAIALERVRAQEAATRAEVARQSEEFKSTLLDAIAHEFKTPLTSIKAASTSLLAVNGPLPPAERELASVIVEETDRLSLLVTEAVHMSQIDAGKLKLEKAPVDVASIVATATTRFAGRGEDRIRGLSDAPLPLVLADSAMVALALRQLLDNSLKYSSPGAPILITAEVEPARVVLHIIDQGPGIPERDRERVFDRFYRRSAVRGGVAGSGLGLHIAREIARAHGGDLWIEPDRSDGTEFCLALPRPTGATP
jgi:two-component system sensor histidine kinase KdpD